MNKQSGCISRLYQLADSVTLNSFLSKYISRPLQAKCTVIKKRPTCTCTVLRRLHVASNAWGADFHVLRTLALAIRTWLLNTVLQYGNIAHVYKNVYSKLNSAMHTISKTPTEILYYPFSQGQSHFDYEESAYSSVWYGIVYLVLL